MDTESETSLGVINCGLFGLQDDYEEASLSLDQLFHLERPSMYIYRAAGDSMAPLIFPGDYLILDRSKKLRSGSIIAAYYEGVRMCKRFMKTRSGLWLISENRKHQAIKLNEFCDSMFLGEVVGLSRRFSHVE